MDLPLNTRHLTIEYRTTESIKPDVRNARTHSKIQIEQIKASIEAFGFTNPILIDSEGVIISGHRRLRAAKDCHLDKVPTIMLEGLTDAQVRGLRLADNKIALNAGWDFDILHGELADLSSVEMDFDLSLTGFSIGEIDFSLNEGPDDDVIPEVPTEPNARAGDIWELGVHRIGCGDGRDVAFLNAVIGEGEQVDMAFLDPPYNVPISGHANAKGRHREFAMASGEMSETVQLRIFQEAMNGSLPAIRKVLKWIAMRDEYRERSVEKPMLKCANFRIEPTDPDNVDDVMLMLEIAHFSTDEMHISHGVKTLLLETWVSQKALSRSGGPELSKDGIDWIECCTHNSGSIKWPRGVRYE